MKLPAFCVLLAASATAACGDATSGRPAAEVLDSAGVRIVVNPVPNPGSDPAWAVFDDPWVDIGTLDGAPEYQLYRVGGDPNFEGGAVRLDDGTLVVGNGGTSELRFFDAEGRFLHSSGGKGGGPGEFQALRLLGRFGGDSLLVYDMRQQRASVFDSSGTFARTYRVGEAAGLRFPFPQAVLADGSMLVRQGLVIGPGDAKTGTVRTPAQVFLVDRDGAVRDTLGQYDGNEAYMIADARMVSIRTVTFGRGIVDAASTDRVVVGTNDAWSLDVFDERGRLLQVVRQQGDPVPTTDDDFTRFNAAELAKIDDENFRKQSRQMFDEMPRPETFPAYRSVRFDEAGRLWVESYPRPGEEHGEWRVFDADGSFLARVVVPAGLDVQAIGRDWILGVVKDDLDVEHLRVYRLDTSGSG